MGKREGGGCGLLYSEGVNHGLVKKVMSMVKWNLRVHFLHLHNSAFCCFDLGTVL